jgi:hypothetical protein
MKKVLSILAAVAMVISLVACGNNSSGQGSSEEQIPMSNDEIKQMYADVNEFKGRTIELTGKIFGSIDYDSDGVYFQMYADPANYEMNTVVAYGNPDAELSDGDYVKVIGKVSGEFEGENMLGAKITAPVITADSAEVLTYQDAVAPTLYTYIPNESTLTQNGYSVTVEKVELAEQETRVYIKVENNGAGKFNLYSFNSLIIQNGKQYEEETNYEADYPDVQTDLSVGVSTEGIFTSYRTVAAFSMFLVRIFCSTVLEASAMVTDGNFAGESVYSPVTYAP